VFVLPYRLLLLFLLSPCGVLADVQIAYFRVTIKDAKASEDDIQHAPGLGVVFYSRQLDARPVQKLPTTRAGLLTGELG
jgi:hypothetical protein